jgi:endothelin-converting enzyme/putative endopeptidase
MTRHYGIRLDSTSEAERRVQPAAMVSLLQAVVLLLVSSGFLARAQSPQATPAVAASPYLDHFDATQVDRSLDPCVDFYQYTCKKWVANNPIPPDQANWWLGAKLMIWNQTTVHDILEKAAKDQQRSPSEQKIGDYYASCMNEDEINAKGITAIQPELDRIAAMQRKAQLPEVLARIHRLTFTLAPATDSGATTALFGFSSGQDLEDASKVVAVLDQGGLGLPDRDYYLNPDGKSSDLRHQYVEHLQKTFQLLDETPAQAMDHAKTVMDLETALAKVSLDIVKRRDAANVNHRLSLQEVRALGPAFAWDQYFKRVKAPQTNSYLVMTPEFFKGVDRLVAIVPLASWKTYLRWQLVNASSSLLSGPFADEKFDFYGRTLTGQKAQRPRWRRCVQSVDRDLGEALGQEYVARAFAGDSKQRMLNHVHALEAALRADIEQMDWMSPTTRQAAILKLEKIQDKIGYPDHWRDYSNLQIVRGDALGNAYRSGEFELHRQLLKIGKPVDPGEWTVSPSVPNAYYDSQRNAITFPAAILQPPLFDAESDDAANFGAIGAIIGHELTHGFDDQGRKFDSAGNLRDWWTADDGKEFDKKAQCIADEYSGMEATPGVKLNGKLTLGENTADNGGLRIAYMALESTLAGTNRARTNREEYSPEQRFFLAYGESWCSNATPKYLRNLAQSNPHSPPRARVNGVVSNMPEFQKAFGCKSGQPMVRENACHVW